MHERRFVRIEAGLVHVRLAGEATTPGLPVFLAHSGPGSSRTLVPMLSSLGETRRVLAPDMLGNGDSDPPGVAAPDVEYYVSCAVQLLDRLEIERVDFYGQHSGAQIGCELAIRHPHRVGKLVLDGIALFTPEDRAELLARYAPEVAADDHGGHLLWAWRFVEGLSLHFPYYARDPAHRLLDTFLPPPDVRQALVVDLLKALPTYQLAYRAMFRHVVADRLPLIAAQTLLMSVIGDPLARFLGEASSLLPAAQSRLVHRDERIETVRRFFAA